MIKTCLYSSPANVFALRGRDHRQLDHFQAAIGHGDQPNTAHHRAIRALREVNLPALVDHMCFGITQRDPVFVFQLKVAGDPAFIEKAKGLRMFDLKGNDGDCGQCGGVVIQLGSWLDPRV